MSFNDERDEIEAGNRNAWLKADEKKRRNIRIVLAVGTLILIALLVKCAG